MLALSNWVKPRPHGQILRDLVGANGKLPEYFAECRIGDVSLENFGATVAVTESYVDLLMRLAAHVRGLCRGTRASHAAEFGHYVEMISHFKARFDVGILSLNYDDVALQAWPDAFCGFSEQRDAYSCRFFDPVAVLARSEYGFLYHLHGSVHHTLAAFGEPRGVFRDQIRWRDDLTGPFTDGVRHGGSILNRRSDGIDIPASTLIAGGLKSDQLLSEPFQTLFSALQRHVHEADSILICGYGFGDFHVNRLLFESHDARREHSPANDGARIYAGRNSHHVFAV